LNYLVFKNYKEGQSGHYLKAYQLTPPIQNFQDIGRQCGVMFYIPASYTSAICPVCGFRKNISTPVGKLEKNKELIDKFTIFYEGERDRFRISYKRNDFYKDEKQSNKKGEIKLFKNKELKDNFTFYSNVERLKYQKNRSNRGGETKARNPHQELKDLFRNNNIDFENNNDILGEIKQRQFENENFYKPLIYLLTLILQLRNSKTVKNKDGITDENESRDFIQCPACYFHSENNLLGLDKKYIGLDKFEYNGDANGAYNIARKGGLVLQKINKIKKMKGDLQKIDYQDLVITQDEWDKKVQV
jgi:CRISPR-associated protein Cpf1